MKHKIRLDNIKTQPKEKHIAPIVGAGLIGAGASLVGGLLGSFGQSNTNKANERINERNLQWQEEMWNKTNEYNNATNQRQRLLDAGINPLSVQGMGTAQAQNLSAPTQLPMQNSMAAIGQGVADAGLKYAQMKNIEADTNLKNEEAGKTNAETATINGMRDGQIQLQNVTITNVQKDTDLKVSQVKQIARTIEFMDDQAAEIGQHIELMKAQGAELMENVAHLQRIDDIAFKHLLLEQGVAQATIDNLHAQSIAALRNAAANLIQANAAQRQAAAAEQNAATNAATGAAEVRLLNKQGEYYGTLKIGQTIENGKASIEFDVAQAEKEGAINYAKGKAKTAKIEPYVELAGDAVEIIGGAIGAVARGKEAFAPAARRTISTVNSTSNSTVNSTSNSTVTHRGSRRRRR